MARFLVSMPFACFTKTTLDRKPIHDIRTFVSNNCYEEKLFGEPSTTALNFSDDYKALVLSYAKRPNQTYYIVYQNDRFNLRNCSTAATQALFDLSNRKTTKDALVDNLSASEVTYSRVESLTQSFFNHSEFGNMLETLRIPNLFADPLVCQRLEFSLSTARSNGQFNSVTNK